MINEGLQSTCSSLWVARPGIDRVLYVRWSKRRLRSYHENQINKLSLWRETGHMEVAFFRRRGSLNPSPHCCHARAGATVRDLQSSVRNGSIDRAKVESTLVEYFRTGGRQWCRILSSSAAWQLRTAESRDIWGREWWNDLHLQQSPEVGTSVCYVTVTIETN